LSCDLLGVVRQGIDLYVFTSVINYLLTTSSVCYASVLNKQGTGFSDTLVIPGIDRRRRIFVVHRCAVDILVLLRYFAVLVYSWSPNSSARCSTSRKVPGSIPGRVTGEFFRGIRQVHVPGVDSAFRNEYQDIPGGKEGRCVGLTTLRP
jgi:hypothetical protein